MKIEVISQIQPWKDDGICLRKINKLNRREHPSSISKNSLNEISKKNGLKKKKKR